MSADRIRRSFPKIGMSADRIGRSFPKIGMSADRIGRSFPKIAMSADWRFDSGIGLSCSGDGINAILLRHFIIRIAFRQAIRSFASLGIGFTALDSGGAALVEIHISAVSVRRLYPHELPVFIIEVALPKRWIWGLLQ